MKMTVLLLALCFPFFSLKAQQSTLDVVGMHQLIDESQAENKLQVQAKDRQSANTGNEYTNLSLTQKFKTGYRILQQRFSLLGTMINAADIGIYAAPMVKQIVADQSRILQLAQRDPTLSLLGIQTQIAFADRADALARYIAGLVLTIEDINQMKPSDRKLLFDEVISELSLLQELSGNILNLLKYHRLASALKTLDPVQNYISTDQSLIVQILQNAKYLKR